MKSTTTRKSTKGTAGTVALLVAMAICGSANASPITLNIAGTLTGGGSYAGSASYDSTATDDDPGNPSQGIFALLDFDITIDTDDPATSVRLLPGFGTSNIARVDGMLANAISLYFSRTSLGESVAFALAFVDLTQTPTPYHPNVAPSLSDFGPFQEILFTSSGAGFRSYYNFRDDDPTEIDVHLDVTSGSVAAVPEPGTLALLGLSLAGLAATRRRKQ